MPAIINSDSGVITGSAGLKIHGNSDGILEIQNNGVTSLVVANSYIRIPVGNTATRPSATSAGMLRFNNTSNVFEGYNGTSWANISAPLTFTPANVEYLVVAGGGGGGGWAGGGGGAGGARTGNLTIQALTTYIVTIGGGGSGQAAATDNAYTNGSDTTFGSITSVGGGRGGKYTNTALAGQPGGSGGGGSYNLAAGSGTPGQGNPGGTGITGNYYAAGGGGGAGGIGTNGTAPKGGDGGIGLQSNITGISQYYAGGGGGTGIDPTTGGTGGLGGGGNGGTNTIGASGSTNTGGGGGGAGASSPTGSSHKGGGAGGSGVVIIAYENIYSSAIVDAGLAYTLNTTSRPGFLVYTFTAGTGTISWS